MQYLLNLCGLECTYVTSETHAWNLLRLEGDYYHLDVTWGDSSETGKERSRSETVSYDCFCITTEELSRLKAHTPQSDFPLPVCTATKCNYHRRHGLFFEKFDFDRVRAIVCESVRYRRLEVSLKFASRELFDEAKKQLVGQGRFWEAMQYAGLKSGIRLSPRYRYTVREELFTITFLMEKL